MTILSKILKVFKDPESVILKLNEFRIRNNIIMYSKVNPHFFFIQIGSHDGKTSDPINELIIQNKWKGILIEPVSYLFEKLKINYQNQKQLIFENVAISKEEGIKDFYRIEKNSEQNNPVWYDQIGSFDKSVIMKHKDRIPNFEKHLIKEKIRSITLQNLLKKHNVEQVNLLLIDTEGYDYEIIKTINFNEIKPQMILYEHLHLSNRDKISCKKLLKKQGYKLIVKYGDTFAFL